mgnify:CR=1 FL=1
MLAVWVVIGSKLRKLARWRGLKWQNEIGKKKTERKQRSRSRCSFEISMKKLVGAVMGGIDFEMCRRGNRMEENKMRTRIKRKF